MSILPQSLLAELDKVDGEKGLVTVALEISRRISIHRGDLEGEQIQRLYMALASYCESMKIPVAHFLVFKGQNLYSTFKDKAQFLIPYVNQFGEHRHHRWMALAREMFAWLAEWLNKCGCPVSVSTLVNNMDKIPGVVDTKFPGYVDSGMAKIIAKGLLD